MKHMFAYIYIYSVGFQMCKVILYFEGRGSGSGALQAHIYI